MCGIAGIVGFDERDRRAVVASMCKRIAHRGPDDHGLHHEPGVALGMQRLSIIDVGGGHQPMYADRQRYCIVFNGEIYNYRQLRSQLIELGHEFETRSDTEVIVVGYAQWGKDVFRRLDGMFAIALWDTVERSLVLARDRMGEKPLYVWLTSEWVSFASEPKCFEELGRRPALDRGSIDQALALGYVPAPDTPWAGVTKVAPGCMVTCSGDLQPHVQRYWSLPGPGNTRSEAPVEELESLILEATASRLLADVEVGVLLSGGIDSSLVAWAASRAVSGLKTFSVSIGHGGRDESPWARHVAGLLHTDHHEVRVESADLRDQLDRMTELHDEPFADASTVPTYLISRFAVGSCKVVLAGDGGDELLSGYPRYTEPSWIRHLSMLPGWMRHSLARQLIDSPSRARSRVANALALTGESPAARYLSRYALMTPTMFDYLTGRPAPFLPVSRDVADGFANSYAEGARRYDLLHYLPGDLLTKVDRASMAVSLEVRCPFLSPSIVEWSAQLSPGVLGPPGAKELGRALVSKHLGPEIAGRRKQGFSLPLDQWLRTDLADLLDDLSAVFDLGIVDVAGFRLLRERLAQGRQGTAGPLWSILCIDRWLHRWT